MLTYRSQITSPCDLPTFASSLSNHAQAPLRLGQEPRRLRIAGHSISSRYPALEPTLFAPVSSPFPQPVRSTINLMRHLDSLWGPLRAIAFQLPSFAPIPTLLPLIPPTTRRRVPSGTRGRPALSEAHYEHHWTFPEYVKLSGDRKGGANDRGVYCRPLQRSFRVEEDDYQPRCAITVKIDRVTRSRGTRCGLMPYILLGTQLSTLGLRLSKGSSMTSVAPLAARPPLRLPF